MRVPAHNHRDPGRHGIEIQLIPVVEDVNMPARQFDHLRRRKPPAPPFTNHIPPDRRHRSNLPKPVENRRITHVSCVKNVPNPAQLRDRLRSEQAVRIRDNTDQQRQIPIVSRVRGSR